MNPTGETWELKRPLSRHVDTGIGRSPHNCEECQATWIYGPFAWCLMHYCKRRDWQGFVFTDYTRVAHQLEDIHPRLAGRKPELTVVTGTSDNPETPTATLAAAS